jgi:uncharacterized protein (TIGR03086 family)
MSQALRNFTNALYGFEHVVRLVPDKKWAAKAPCPGWNGTDVLAHTMATVENVRTAATKGTMSTKGPKVGADPLASWVKLRTATLEALDQPGALHKITDSFMGPIPVDSLMPLLSSDVLIHTWDLARTAKVDERLEPVLVKSVMALMKSFPPEMMRSSGMFAAAIKPAPGADAQTKLLNFSGRAV